MIAPQSQLTKTLERFTLRGNERQRNIQLIKEKRYFDNFPELTEKTQEVNKIQIKSLERILSTNDLVDISFLSKALISARTVGRIWISNTSNKILGHGTGFHISPSLIMTNHHVLPDSNTASLGKIEMNYQFDTNQVLLPSDVFSLYPGAFSSVMKALTTPASTT